MTVRGPAVPKAVVFLMLPLAAWSRAPLTVAGILHASTWFVSQAARTRIQVCKLCMIRCFINAKRTHCPAPLRTGARWKSSCKRTSFVVRAVGGDCFPKFFRKQKMYMRKKDRLCRMRVTPAKSPCRAHVARSSRLRQHQSFAPYALSGSC